MIKKVLQHTLEKLPFQRVVLYLIVIGFLPTLFTGLYYFKKKREWDEVSEEIRTIHYLTETKARKQYFNTLVRHIYAESDPLYLENQLEPLAFLKKEKEKLEQLLQSPTFIGNEAAEKRYAHLTSAANHLEFLQGSPQIGEGIQESICSLSHPVQVDSNDLKEILSRIEGNRKGKPQLLITEFKLSKRPFPSGNEVFELNVKLLRREFPS